MVSPESAELCIRSDRAGLFDNVLCVFLQPGLRVLGMYSMLDEHAQDRYLSSKILLASQIAAFKIGAPRVARFFFTRRERLHCALPKGCPLDCWPYWYQIMSVVCWVTYWRNEADASWQWRRFKRSAPSQPSGVASAAAPPGGALSHYLTSLDR
ncbi:uncharacterized protein [Lolium perenne]|uniref:uncharacterized protein isoform X1 n=1 Tax=Lolium perenne TaxID=4522 RepID=UPI003A991A51